MWYSIGNIPSEIPAPDRALLAAYGNLLTEYGFFLDLLEAYDVMNPSGERPLDWQSGNRIDGLWLSQDSEQPGWPLVEPAIVVFNIDGDRLPCYVLDIDAHTVVDSRDGQEKPGSVLGKPVAWASFAEPHPPIEAPAVEPPAPAGRHTNSLVDGIAYTSLGTVKRMYVARPEGIDLTDFSGYISTFRDFVGVPNSHLAYGAEVRVIGLAKHPVLPSGQEFWMTLDDWGNFGSTGVPVRLHGYVRGHLSEQKPSALAPKLKPELAEFDEISVRPLVKDRGWAVSELLPAFNYLRTDRQPVRYRVLRDIAVRDHGNDQSKVINITKGTTIAIYGTFWDDGEQYLLPRLDDPNIDIFDYWFGIPEFDEYGERNVEEIAAAIKQPLPMSAIQFPAPRRRGVDDIIVNVSTLFEVVLVRGVVKIKKHVERIKQWK